MKKWLHRLGPFLVVAIFIAAAWMLYNDLHQYRIRDIREAAEQIPPWRLWAALGLTVVNYLALIGYDYLAIRAIGHPLSLPRVALASFTGFVTSYNFGALLGGTSVRYRLYSAWGLSAIEILQLVVMLGITFWVGIIALAGVFFVVDPFPIPEKLHLPYFDNVRPLGFVLLAVSIGYVMITVVRKKPLRIGGTEIQLPRTGMTVLQLFVAALDLTIAAGCLYMLVSHNLPGVHFGEFLGMYLLAVTAVIITHVPGGVGVFELVVLTFAAPSATVAVVAALLVFRVIYYLLPLGVALLLLAGNELMLRRVLATRIWVDISRWGKTVAATVLAWAAFVAGAVLLFSGAASLGRSRLGDIEHLIPWPVIEGSHFIGSLAGAGLLVLARGLQRRLDSAWWLTIVLMVVGIATSLLKGLDYEEAILLGFITLCLVGSRKSFYRKGSLLHEPFTAGWIGAVVLAVICSIWLGLFARHYTQYSTEMFWTFAVHSDAPRFVRATVGAVSVLLLFALGKLMTAERPRPAEPSANEMTAAAAVIARVPRTSANLAFLGDKSFLFNKEHTAFVMYAIQNRAWVALGDPVGLEGERAELVWQFRELVDRYDGWPIFYQVPEESLPVYLDQGMTLLKLGEEARVPLESFSLEGGSRKDLRHARNHCQQEQCEFAVVPAADVPPLLSRLKTISNTWLEEKKTQEMRFSMGFFNESYLMRFPCAVVKRGGEVIAFANVWCGADHEELSVDLMRYLPDAPSGVMQFLFVELMLWGKEQGYKWFNLGMAPLSGIESRPLAPMWNRAVNLVYWHGDHFYNFEGLRTFKEKFEPEWSPKYLASPGGLALPRILAAVTTLVTGKNLAETVY